MAKLYEENLTQDILKDILCYDPETGLFTWKRQQGKMKAGSRAGTYREGNYVLIGIDKEHYFGHRLAWLYVYGEWPEDMLDHINNDRRDNRIANLRKATNQTNGLNRGKNSNNTSGVKNISWSASRKKWEAELRVNTKRVKLGRFSLLEDAVRAITSAREKLAGDYANHG